MSHQLFQPSMRTNMTPSPVPLFFIITQLLSTSRLTIPHQSAARKFRHIVALMMAVTSPLLSQEIAPMHSYITFQPEHHSKVQRPRTHFVHNLIAYPLLTTIPVLANPTQNTTLSILNLTPQTPSSHLRAFANKRAIMPHHLCSHL